METKNNNVLDIEELTFFNEFQLLTTLLKNWNEKAEQKKITDKAQQELTNASSALSKIGMYVLNLQSRQRTYDIQLSKWRMKKLEAEAETKKLYQTLVDSKIEL
tara:strand:- start:47 stop:358 length:312 start_codon:yes stop_codon:yes gene_type:complete